MLICVSTCLITVVACFFALFHLEKALADNITHPRSAAAGGRGGVLAYSTFENCGSDYEIGELVHGFVKEGSWCAM